MWALRVEAERGRRRISATDRGIVAVGVPDGTKPETTPEWQVADDARTCLDPQGGGPLLHQPNLPSEVIENPCGPSLEATRVSANQGTRIATGVVTYQSAISIRPA